MHFVSKLCILIYVWITTVDVVNSDTCEKLSSCSCKHSSGQIIDLSVLSSGEPENP